VHRSLPGSQSGPGYQLRAIGRPALDAPDNSKTSAPCPTELSDARALALGPLQYYSNEDALSLSSIDWTAIHGDVTRLTTNSLSAFEKMIAALTSRIVYGPVCCLDLQWLQRESEHSTVSVAKSNASLVTGLSYLSLYLTVCPPASNTALHSVPRYCCP
jgi:hypothetical protein